VDLTWEGRLLHAILLVQLFATSPQARDAQELVHASILDFDLGNFEKALTEAEQAYRLYPLAQILFNIGQCHRALKHWERAAFFYERYLSRLPAAPNRSKVEALLAEVQYRLKVEQLQAPPAEPAVPPAKVEPKPEEPAEPAHPILPSTEAAPAESVPAAALEPETKKVAAKPSHSHKVSYVLGAVAVASLAVVVIGVVEVEDFQSLIGRVNHPVSYSAWVPDQQSALNEAPSIPVWEWVAGATGAVALGTGTAAVLTW
jgi:tetratricopeptide (TPR) repeat protein